METKCTNYPGVKKVWLFDYKKAPANAEYYPLSSIKAYLPIGMKEVKFEGEPEFTCKDETTRNGRIQEATLVVRSAKELMTANICCAVQLVKGECYMLGNDRKACVVSVVKYGGTTTGEPAEYVYTFKHKARYALVPAKSYNSRILNN